jgi:hypothetical protein
VSGSNLASVPALTDKLDLESLRLSAGEGRRLELAVEIEPLVLGASVMFPSRCTRR